MAHIVNIETSDFTNAAINIYQQNRVSQYSKYLDRTPLFVTYYHISTVHSRVDVGTGGVEHELGERSPIRFVKITEFPIYNIPDQLKPEMEYDETGADVELNLSQLVVLPNTIEPYPGDYFIVDLPGSPQYLFRVNRPNYNTIQSNDFYELDADLKYIGDNAEREKKITGQIVAEYKTIFDKIGTDDHCFIQTTDIELVNTIANAIKKLCKLYKDAYYNVDCNAFLFRTGFTQDGTPSYLWDHYLSKFINDSEIYYDEKNRSMFYLTPCDILPDQFDYTYSRTLYQAILDRDVMMMHQNIYSFINPVQKRLSVCNFYHYYTDVVTLVLGSTKVKATNGDGIPVWFSIEKLPCCGPTWTPSDANQYFSKSFIEQLMSCEINTDNILELIIWNFLHRINTPLSIKELLQSIDIDSIQTFYYLPIVIYILSVWYGEYFKADKSLQ